MKSIVRSTLCAAVAVFVTQGAIDKSLAGTIANGSGWLYTESGAKRTFAFTAVEHKDGSVSGQAQVNNRENGIIAHIAINCAVTDAVSGDLNISGVITSSNNDVIAPVGAIVFFAVRDNGNGKPDPDQITQLGAAPKSYVDWFGAIPLDPGTIDYFELEEGATLLDLVNLLLNADVSDWPVDCETLTYIFNNALGGSVFSPEEFSAIEGGSINVH